MQANELSRILEDNGFSKLERGVGWSKGDVMVQITYGIVYICYVNSMVSFMLDDVGVVYEPKSGLLTIFEEDAACTTFSVLV